MSRKTLCAALLGFQLAYVFLTALTGRAPAWTMFSKAEAVSWSLRGPDGPVDLKKHLPPIFYLSDAQMVRYAAACLCKKEHPEYVLTIDGVEEQPCAH